jgi:hypothetical protein
MNERDEFEAWASGQGLDVSYAKSCSTYEKAETFYAWRVWQAARAAQKQVLAMEVEQLKAESAKLRAEAEQLKWEVKGVAEWRELYSSLKVENAKLRGAAAGALTEIECVMHEAYNSATPVCCGRSGQECCGNPNPEWSEFDQRTMDRFAPHQRALNAALAATQEKS